MRIESENRNTLLISNGDTLQCDSHEPLSISSFDIRIMLLSSATLFVNALSFTVLKLRMTAQIEQHIASVTLNTSMKG